ncbi:MAG: hypothetical protein AB7O65_04105 [Candidatus Korobacteraceae bacterium]
MSAAQKSTGAGKKPNSASHSAKAPARESQPYEPLTNRAKFDRFLRTTVSPYTFASAAMNATWLQINGEPYAYGGGMTGWSKRFGTRLVGTEVRTFFSQYFFPTVLNQDPRYFPKRKGNIFGRGWYAATRVLAGRHDSGRAVFNSSYLFSVAATRTLANAYAPADQRGVRNTTLSILGDYGSDAGSLVLQEFWPDIMRLFRRHAPKPLVDIQNKIPGELMGAPEEDESEAPVEAEKEQQNAPTPGTVNTAPDPKAKKKPDQQRKAQEDD